MIEISDYIEVEIDTLIDDGQPQAEVIRKWRSDGCAGSGNTYPQRTVYPKYCPDHGFTERWGWMLKLTGAA